LNFSDLIISALIPRNKFEREATEEVFKELAKSGITSDFFNGNYKTLYEIVAKQFTKESLLDLDILETYLSAKGLDDQAKTEVKILFSSCKEQLVPLEKLQEILPEFINQVNTIRFSNLLLTAGTILTDDKNKPNSLQKAKNYLISRISGLTTHNSENFPQGSMADSMDLLWENYDKVEKESGIGLLNGIKEIDALTKGAQHGQLWIIAGFMGEGKSQALRSFSYYASVIQKKNIVFATLEMPYGDIVTLFTSLHSLHPKFNNTFGVKSKDIFDGTLSDRDKELLKIVTDDYKDNKDYGINYILQLPWGTTVSALHEKLMYLNTLFPIDGVYLDYTALMRPDFMLNSTIAQTTQIANDLKLMALGFNNGKGIPVVAAHQISRDARTNVEKSEEKRYDFAFLSDSAGVERAADFIGWILRTADMEQNREVKFGVNKFRRGKRIPDFMLREYYDCSKIESMQMDQVMNRSTDGVSLLDS
jgi:replicative DNA helicase